MSDPKPALEGSTHEACPMCVYDLSDETRRTCADHRPVTSTMSSYGTRQGAEAFIRAALGQWAAEHDVPAIADALHEHAGQCWDMGRVDTDLFRQVVEAHAIPGEGESARGGNGP